MWIFTEIAEWFEKKRAQSDRIVDEWVEDSDYNKGVMLVAATTKAVTTFGAGFVDLLKLGDGVKQGDLKGVGTDALRVVAIFPLGKAAQLVKSQKGVVQAKLVVDTGGPNCFWVASAKAFAQVGQKSKGKLFATVEEMAKSLGMSMDDLWVIPNLSKGVSYLRQLGASVGIVKAISSTKDIASLVPRDGSVLLIAVRVIRAGMKESGHAIYAFRNAFGQIRYMDRTVGNVVPTVFKSIDEIAPLYRATALVPYEGAILANVFAKTVAHEAPRLVIPILGVIATEEQL